MKKRNLFIAIIISIFLTACSSTKVNTDQANSKSADTAFLNLLTTVKIEMVQSPAPTTKGKMFSKQFIVSVKNSQTSEPMQNFSLTISYPVSADENKTENVRTNSDGTYIFDAPVCNFAVNGKFLAYANPNSKKQNLIDAAVQSGASADFFVRSDIPEKGAILFIYEYDEKNKPARNFYNLISEFQKYGCKKVGNAPVNDESDIGKSIESLYKRNKEIVNDEFGYFIGGTVKYVKPIEKNENGFYCALTAEIWVVDMTNGKEIYRNSYSCETTQPKWEKAASKCKEDLGKIIADDLIYKL
ncbi:MAG: hypothetical protein IKX23_02550 [Treponema sp.]|nr:hypothetical protein [Treponema sp.]